MSGGSYDYLFTKDLIDYPIHSLEAMATRLAGLGYAQDAAQETFAALAAIRAAEARHEATRRRLGEVWRAVEWWDSCDSSEDRVKEALSKYRGETAQPLTQISVDYLNGEAYR